MKQKNKGSVLRAKKRVPFIWILTFITGGVLWWFIARPQLGLIMLNNPEKYTSLSIVLVILDIIAMLLVFMIFISLNWSQLNRYEWRLKRHRYVANYNRCLDALQRKDFDRVRQYHDNYLSKCDYFPHLSDRVRLGYRFVKNVDIEDEYLEINDQFKINFQN